jgi:hypothetical protein
VDLQAGLDAHPIVKNPDNDDAVAFYRINNQMADMVMDADGRLKLGTLPTRLWRCGQQDKLRF